MRHKITAAVAAFLLVTVPATAMAHIYRVADGSFVPLQEVLQDLGEARLIFMGELHDNEGHHRAQLQIIRALQEAGLPVAVGLEMVQRDDQLALDAYVTGVWSEEQFLPVFFRNWSMWDKYQAIFRYARDQKIPLVALNVSRNITQQVAQNGFASLSPEQIGELPAGIRCDISPDYEAFIRRALGGHGHGGNKFVHFCEAQMLWDSVMATELLKYLEGNPDRVVVVLAGAGHSWKYGIPEQVQRRRPLPMRILLPEVPGRIEHDKVTVKEADYIMLGLEEAPLH